MSALDLFASALGAFILITIVLLPYYLKVDRSVLDDLKKTEALLAQCEVQKNGLSDQISSLQTNIQVCRDQNQQLQEQTQTLQSSVTGCQEEHTNLQTQLTQTQSNLQQTQQNLNQCNNQKQQIDKQLQQSQHFNQQCAKELQEIFLIAVMTWDTKDDIDLHVVDPQGREYYYKQKVHPNSHYELSVDTTVGPGVEIWEAPSASPGVYQVYYRLYKQNDPKHALIKGRIYYRNKVVVLDDKQIVHQGEKVYVTSITIDQEGQVVIDTTQSTLP
jgi:flagellar motor protein MotB